MKSNATRLAVQPKRHAVKSSRFVFALATSLAAAALALAGTPARAGSGFSNIRVWNSSHCLDSAKQDDSKLQIWSCDGGDDEQWLEIYNSQLQASRFLNQRTGRCIAAPSSGEGAVTLQVCDPLAPNQEWHVLYADNPYGPPSGWFDVWQNASSGFCLNTNSVANGTVVTAAGCNVSDQYQRWHKD